MPIGGRVQVNQVSERFYKFWMGGLKAITIGGFAVEMAGLAALVTNSFIGSANLELAQTCLQYGEPGLIGGLLFTLFGGLQYSINEGLNNPSDRN